MRYFLDTEFLDDGDRIHPISVAVVAEDGREFLRCNRDFDLALCDAWLRENVVPHLPPPSSPLWVPRKQIGADLVEFVGDDPKPEFWGYYADYDWVLVAQLFGRMLDLPPHFPKLCLDVKQLIKDRGVTPPPQLAGHHDALADAAWIREAFRACLR